MMNPNPPHQTSNQTLTPLSLPPSQPQPQPQVNAGMNQQMCNANVVSGLFPNNNNNMPNLPPSGFMNFHNFPLQNGPNGNVVGFNPQQSFRPFQFNPSQLSQQQQQGQLFAQNPMNQTAAPYSQNVGNEQALLQNTIQNIYQLLQLQNRNNAPQCPPPVGNFPIFQNPVGNATRHQNPGFIANQQFGMSIPNRPVMGQGNLFLPGASGLVQTQQPPNVLATATNFQNPIPQGVGPQNQNFPANQMFGMPNINGPMQHVNQGQQRFAAPMMNANVSRQMVNTGQTQNTGPTIPNFENNHGNMATNANGGRTECLHKNFTCHKGNDASHKGFKSQFHHTKYEKDKGGICNGIMNKVGNNKAAVNSGPQSSTNFKKLTSLNYTEQEIKQWREARKKNFPTSVTVEQKCKKEQALSDATNQEAMLRRQQLQEILAKQAELGCEVAEIPPSYFSGSDIQNPRDKKHERERYKKGKFKNKRGKRFKNNRTTKRIRAGDQDSFKAYYQTHEPKPNDREPSLLQKLLTRDIKRDKNHLLQVLRFIAVNLFFNGEPDKSLRFPSVVVSETSSGVPDESTSIYKGSEKAQEKELVEAAAAEEEGEITD